jgi:hypothetical protein
VIHEPVCMRIFFSREDAESAQDILKKGGFVSSISEDHFGELKLTDLGMVPRFRLMVEQRDYYKIAQFLANKLKGIESVEG